MLKANKIFLALIFALLLVAVVETFFIFVYKPQSALPNQAVQNPLPTPPSRENKLLTPDEVDMIVNWPHLRNANLSLVETITGVVKSIDPITPDKSFKLYLEGEPGPGKDTTSFMFTPDSLKNTSVYIQDTKTGVITPSDIKNLKPKDNLLIKNIGMLGVGTDKSNDKFIIYILK